MSWHDLKIPDFETFEDFETFIKDTYVFSGKNRLSGMVLSDYALQSMWDKFIRHADPVKTFICSSQMAFEGFMTGAYPVNP